MTWGAIRNAQLLAVHLPDWRLRVYVPSGGSFSDVTSSNRSNSATTTMTRPISQVIRPRIVATLRHLGAEVVPTAAPGDVLRRPPISALVTDPDADYVLMRRAEWRLSQREAAAVLDWTRAAESQDPDAAIVHCLHDDQRHADRALVEGLWGFRPAALLRRLAVNLTMAAISQLDVADGSDDSLLDRIIWPHVADAAYCHDSVATCYDGPLARSIRQFPVSRLHGDSFVGQTFDENQDPVDDENEVSQLLSCSHQHQRLSPTWTTD